MRIADKIKRSFRGLINSKARTILTILGVSVASLVLSVVFALGEGARAQTIKVASTIVSDREILVGPEQTDTANPTQNPTDQSGIQKYTDTSQQSTSNTNRSQPKFITTTDIDKLNKISGVEMVIPQYSFSVQYFQVGSPTSQKYSAGISQFNPEVHPEFLTTNISGELGTNEVIVPESFLQKLNIGSANEALGQNLFMTYQNADGTKTQQGIYKIAAVTKTPLGANAVTGNSLLISEAGAKNLYEFQTKPADRKGFNQVTVITAQGLTRQQVDQIVSQLKSMKFQATSSTEISKNSLDVINGIQLFLLIFAGATLLASLFGIINTEIISILERYKEIGLLKAVGMHNSTLFFVFLLEAVWIGLIGSVLGILIAIALSGPLNPLIAGYVGIFDKDNPALIFTLQHAGIIVGSITLVSVIGGLLPAWKATRLDPIDILRTE